MSNTPQKFLRSLCQTAVLACGLATTGLAGAASGELYVVAEIVAKSESADELRKLIVPFAAKSRKEPGCREYVLMEVDSEPGRFLTYERWTGRPALDKHMKTPEMAALGPKLGALLAKPFTQTFLSAPKAK